MGKIDKKLALSSVFSFSWLSKLKRKSSSSTSAPSPVKRRPSTPPPPPTNSSRSSPLPVSSITNLACSPEVYDNRTGRRVAGFVEPEEDFWRFSFRRPSFECERAPGDGSRPARRAFSVDLESAKVVYSTALDKPEHPPRPTPSFPPLNLKRAHHQKQSKDARRSKKWSTGSKSPARSGELFSPKSVCKVKAVEDMRRRRARPKKKLLKGFAVVKSSWDPQQDFRESMVEMMSEKKMMNAGDELEELLACYLELNPAEFHELIVKVFRQVWFDLNRAMAGGSELERGYFDY